MSSVQQPLEVEVISGVIMGVNPHQSGDKWAVNVQPANSQFTQNLWTKDQQLAGQLSMMVGQHQTFTVNVNTDQNTGKKYRWISLAGQVAQAPPPPQPVQAPPPQQLPFQPQPQPLPQAFPQQAFAQPQQLPFPPPQPAVQPPQTSSSATPRISDDDRESRIMRQTASKVAAILISHIPAEQRTLDNVVMLSERLVSYYRGGVAWPAQDGQGQQPPPDDEDGIPF